MMIVRERIYDINGDLNFIMESADGGLTDRLRGLISGLSDKRKALANAIRQFNTSSSRKNKKQIATVVAALFMTVYGGYSILNISSDKLEDLEEKIMVSNTVSVEELRNDALDIFGPIKNIKIVKGYGSGFRNAEMFTTSEEIKSIIKNHEKVRLKAYTIGDNKITIGWGHAEPIKTSKYRVGHRISMSEANTLFDNDIKTAENGVKRIFRQWEDGGLEVRITQGMFDAMVSIAYNAGISALRTSNFIKLVKEGKFREAENSIIKTRNTGRYGGLDKRREAEKKLFSRGVKKLVRKINQ